MKKELVVKHNSLNQATYSLGLVEARLVLLAIVEARSTGMGITPETYLEISAIHYAQRFNVERHTAYKSLADAAKTLFNRQVTLYGMYKDKPDRQTVRWVSGVSYVDELGIVRIRFSPDVIPLITRLESNFTWYELDQVAELKSAYAVRLYELLVQWRTTMKTPSFALTTFRDLMGLSSKQYIGMSDFKKNVLDLAVNQINTYTDLTVRYEQHKSGRTITGFSFEFKIAPRPDHLEAKLVKPDKAAAKRKVVDALSDYWDRLHGLELAECQKINPALCRADIETMAKALNISALQAMQQIRAQAKKQATTTPRQKGGL